VDARGPALPPHDPEFESPLAPGILPPLDAPENYLRLVANPFLGILGFLGWLAALIWTTHLDIDRELIGPLVPIIAVAFLFGLWRIGPLFQYHCLDCGATGRLSRWREHLCPASALRRQSGRRRRFRGPPLFAQVVLWLWGLFGAIMLARSWGW
jgi:hypothetical protein